MSELIDREETVKQIVKMGEMLGVSHDRDVTIAIALFVQDDKSAFPTVERPHGAWNFVQRGKYVDMVCSVCGVIREEGIAYNMTVEEVLDTISKDDFRVHGKSDFPRYCENCGAKMCVRVERR